LHHNFKHYKTTLVNSSSLKVFQWYQKCDGNDNGIRHLTITNITSQTCWPYLYIRCCTCAFMCVYKYIYYYYCVIYLNVCAYMCLYMCNHVKNIIVAILNHLFDCHLLKSHNIFCNWKYWSVLIIKMKSLNDRCTKWTFIKRKLNNLF
jgi:hypothetical protein